jgi:type IV secretory pathway VirB2 component (pilin)
MKTIIQCLKLRQFRNFWLLAVFLVVTDQMAFADLVSDMNQLQTNVTTISQPLAIIFLIVAGWQKAMGNAQLFVLALVGTVVMFAAPQLVTFISSVFGN